MTPDREPHREPASAPAPPRVVRYALVLRDAPPALDVSRAVKDALLPPRVCRAYGRWMHRLRHIIMPCYALAVVLRVATFFVAARQARVLAPLSALLNLPATIMVTLSLRVSLVKVLVRRFEFRYFLFLNSLWVAAFSLSLTGDAANSSTGAWIRLCVLPFMWVEFTNATLLDAYFLPIDGVFYAAVAAIAQLLALNAALVMDLIDESSHVVLVKTRLRTASTRDVALFTSNAVIFLMARLVYRQRHQIKLQKRRRSTLGRGSKLTVATTECVQVIAYRSKLVLVETSNQIEMPGHNVLTRWATRIPRGTVQDSVPSTITMRLSIVESVSFRCPRALWSCNALLASSSLEKIILRVTTTCATVAIIFSLKSLSTAGISDPKVTRLPATAWITLVSTFIFVVTCARHYSIQLLQRWLTSFDCVMLSLKLTTAHVCACDMLYWDPHVSTLLLCSWLWWHWTITLDALPPVSKHRLGVRLRWWVAPSLLLSAAMQTMLVYELLFSSRLQLRDRELLRFAVKRKDGTHWVVQTVGPFLLSRLIAVWIWTWRLMYRAAWTRSDSELLLFTGALEYDRPRRRPRRARAMHRIEPAALIQP